MNDKQLCDEFGISLEKVDDIVTAIENDDLSDFDFSQVIEGRPLEKEPMETISLKVPRSRMQAVARMAKREGVSRSEFVRRAIDNELIAMA